MSSKDTQGQQQPERLHQRIPRWMRIVLMVDICFVALFIVVYIWVSSKPKRQLFHGHGNYVQTPFDVKDIQLLPKNTPKGRYVTLKIKYVYRKGTEEDMLGKGELDFYCYTPLELELERAHGHFRFIKIITGPAKDKKKMWEWQTGTWVTDGGSFEGKATFKVLKSQRILSPYDEYCIECSPGGAYLYQLGDPWVGCFKALPS